MGHIGKMAVIVDAWLAVSVHGTSAPLLWRPLVTSLLCHAISTIRCQHTPLYYALINTKCYRFQSPVAESQNKWQVCCDSAEL